MKHLLLFFALLATVGCGHGGGSSSDGGTTPKIRVVNDRAVLSWSTGSGMADGYIVEQSTDNANWTQIENVTETSTYLDGLNPGTKYYFRVKSYNSAGDSAYSGSATVTL